MRYDYKCSKCKVEIEVIQSMNDVGDFKCDCGGTNKRYFGNTHSVVIQGLDTLTAEIFDASEGRYIPASKRDAIGKKEGKIWMSHDEAEKEAAKNRKNIKDKMEKKSEKKLKKDLMKVLQS